MLNRRLSLNLSSYSSSKLSQKGSNTRYFWFCRSSSLCWNYLILPTQCESSSRQYAIEWIWLCANKTLFIDIETWISIMLTYHIFFFWFFFPIWSCKNYSYALKAYKAGIGPHSAHRVYFVTLRLRSSLSNRVNLNSDQQLTLVPGNIRKLINSSLFEYMIQEKELEFIYFFRNNAKL